MKQTIIDVAVTLKGTPESFENTVKALETAIRVLKKVESEKASKPPCYASPVPYLEMLLYFYQDICEM